MIIRESNIIDCFDKSINNQKIILSNKISSTLLPVIHYQIHKKIKSIKESKNNITKMRKNIEGNKNSLLNSKEEYIKSKKINLLLNRIDQYISLGNFDKSIRNELLSLVTNIKELPEEKIDFYISEMLRLITKKFSEIEVK